MNNVNKEDLVVLVADKDIEHTLRGLFGRPQALGIRPIRYKIFVEPHHDPGCVQNGVSFLSHFSKQYDYALLLFDYEGSGKEQSPSDELQLSLNEGFKRSNWGQRARAIIIDPELETWVWGSSPNVGKVIGWTEQKLSLRKWMLESGLLSQGETKPRHPKETFLKALYKSRTPRSASIYQRLAERVSLRNCQDSAFQELRNTLKGWFPSTQAPEDVGSSKERDYG